MPTYTLTHDRQGVLATGSRQQCWAVAMRLGLTKRGQGGYSVSLIPGVAITREPAS